MKLVLDGEQAPSQNGFYSGMHWSQRKELADAIHWSVREVIDPNIEPFSMPVDITVTCYYKDRRRRDSDNVCPKMYIDGLRDFVIVDDDTRYVRAVTTVAAHDKENPRVEIEVVPV